MKTVLEHAREIPVIAEVDVLVLGGGPAGIGAAIAAARNGASTLLVERYGFLGGNLTIAMVNPMFTFHDIHGKQVIRGIPGELVDRLVAFCASSGHVTDLTFDNASMTPFDPEGMKIVLLDMVAESGAQTLLHSQVAGVVRDGNNVSAVILESKSGRQAVSAKMVIDCTADADVAARAGAEFILGRQSDGAMQPVTLFFRIGDIDYDRLRSWMKANRHLLKGQPTDKEIDSQEAIAFLGLNGLMEQAQKDGELDCNIAPRALLYQLPGRGQIAVNCTRLQNIDGTNAQHLTHAEFETRHQAWEVYRFLKKHVGGFEDSIMLDSGVQVGVRETRHVVGDYRMVRADVLTDQQFSDGIACGTFAIDIHPPEGGKQVFTGSGKAVYEIPYRCCTPKGFDNLLVAGRCIDATHEAFGSARVMATAMAIGQGVGTAAAMAASEGLTTRQVDIPRLRKTLVEQDVYLLGENTPLVKEAKLVLDRPATSGAAASHHDPFQ